MRMPRPKTKTTQRCSPSYGWQRRSRVDPTPPSASFCRRPARSWLLGGSSRAGRFFTAYLWILMLLSSLFILCVTHYASILCRAGFVCPVAGAQRSAWRTCLVTRLSGLASLFRLLLSELYINLVEPIVVLVWLYVLILIPRALLICNCSSHPAKPVILRYTVLDSLFSLSAIQ